MQGMPADTSIEGEVISDAARRPTDTVRGSVCDTGRAAPLADRCVDAFAAVAAHVQARYRVPVVADDVPEPFKGDLDGATIIVGRDNPPEVRLFLVAHLFGHTVQWNTSEHARRLGMHMPVNPDERMLDLLEAYEREACGFSQRAMHEAGIEDLDQWLADYSACDFAFLRHFYRTGERRAFDGFWREGRPLLTPLDIPGFTPRRWRRRHQAIVV